VKKFPQGKIPAGIPSGIFEIPAGKKFPSPKKNWAIDIRVGVWVVGRETGMVNGL
jgi:hypothetical protein